MKEKVLTLIMAVVFATASVTAQTNVMKSMVTTNADGSYTITVPSGAGPSTSVSPAPSFGQEIQSAFNNILNNTNLLYEAHALYAPGLNHKMGGGFGVVYPFSDYVFTSIRIDWVDGGFWMPQGNVGLQVPIHLHPFGTNNTITITPFTYAGVAVPVSGATIGTITLGGSPPVSNDGQPTAILGAGAAIGLYSPWHLYAVGDIEEWTGFPGKQYRLGLTIHL